MSPLYAISLSGFICEWPSFACILLLILCLLDGIWQMLYWKFVLVDRRTKIESGQRATSFIYLLNAKGSVIGSVLSKFQPQYREAAFMGGQLAYAILTELPAVYVLYDSPFWSNIFLLFIFSVSVWNGGGFYIEVFGRKWVSRPKLVILMIRSNLTCYRFEKELEALRKELAEATARSGRSSPNGTICIMTDDEEPISPQLSPRRKHVPLVAPASEDKKSQ